MSILFVNDDPDDFEVFNEALLSIMPSASCIWVNHCRECFEKLKDSYLPDYIFVDRRMPLMDGIDCAIKIREHETVKHVPIIIYSSWVSEFDKARVETLKKLRFMIKPELYSELQDTLQKLLKPENFV